MNINRYIEKVIKPNIKEGKTPLLDDEEAKVLADKMVLLSEKFVHWKKSGQIVITKAFKEDNPIPELLDFLENIFNTDLPIDIVVWIDFFGIWNSAALYEEPELGFVWASKATSMVKAFEVNTREDIDKLKNQFDELPYLYEQWVETHLETVFCQNSKLNAHRITNALIFLEIEDVGFPNL